MEMVMMTSTIEIDKYKFRMDGYFKSNMDIILNEAIPNNWDAVFVIFGKEGTGKTTLACQGALYSDHKFSIKTCEFNTEQFGHVIDTCDPESSILWDEAITGAMSVAHANKVSQTIISKLTQIRKKRLKLFLCFPYLWMLNKYFVSRCVASFYVYSKGFEDRGYAFAYNQKQTEYLYSLMKEKYRLQPLKAINKAPKSYHFKFPDVFCMDKDAYDCKKESSRVMDEETDPWKSNFIHVGKYCTELGGTVTEIARRCKKHRPYISQVLAGV